MQQIKSSLLFSAHDLIGSNLRKDYQEFVRLSKSSAADIKMVSDRRLQETLAAAFQRVPFYQSNVKRDSTRLEHFPIINKETLSKNFHEFMTPALRAEYEGRAKKSLYSWVKVQTGGSTGTPGIVIHDAAFRDRGRASRLFAQRVCGFPPGSPYFRLMGTMDEISKVKTSKTQRALHWLLNTRQMNAFQMREEDLMDYVRYINNSSIDHLMAYVDSAYQLAMFIERKGLKVRPIKSVMACGGTVTPDFREGIERVFRCKVFNKYGSRECTDMACEGPDGHIYTFSNHIHLETVDDEGKPVLPGQLGRILVTLLGNHSFPLIRYEIGDWGILGENTENDKNALPFPTVKSIEGRSSDFLTDISGNYVTPSFVIHLIGVIHNPGCIRRFQLLQEDHGHYTLLLEIAEDVPSAEFSQLTNSIETDLKNVLGETAVIKFDRRQKLDTTNSGKFLYVKNLTGKKFLDSP